MKVQYMSDLHLEFADMPIPDVAGDVLVLAGDIHVGANAIPWIEQCAHVFKDVIYVLGNHEYYGQKMWKLPDAIQASLAGYSVNKKTRYNNQAFYSQGKSIILFYQFRYHPPPLPGLFLHI